MGALANAEVGKYLNANFVSSFQKVATFRIVAGGQKQGGNVASYFCAPDGRVLHVVAGPVDAGTLLREARWVVETTKKAMADRMQTSRRALDRLLDPENTSVTLHTLQRAAAAIGRQLRLELV